MRGGGGGEEEGWREELVLLGSHGVTRPVAGTVVVQVGKLNRGEEFPNLDMLTTLLPCRQRKDLRRLGEKLRIEELESGVGVGGGAEGEEGEATEEDTEEDLDWGVDQNFSSEAEVKPQTFSHPLPHNIQCWH